MCRIAGIIDKALPNAELQDMVKDMCSILKNGGPDDEGIYSLPEYHLVLGNRRLALQDLSNAGHQPMSYHNGRYHITYNGEIYNFLQLKAQLIQEGFTFKSNSDTEVILASFTAWGTKAFEKFNGMFAFALLDTHNANIYLVRDASGIKPLYYSASDQRLVFASEIKAFKPIPGLQEQDPKWPIFMMAYGHLPEPITTLKHVKPLKKGTFLKYKLGKGTWSTSTFSEFSYFEKISDRKDAIEEVKICLAKAVKRHLLSDAPIGVFLSGGVDSSIIALLANDKSNTHLNTLSLYFAESQYSEKRYQDILLPRLSCNHHQHLLSEKEFHNNLPAIISDMDLPSTDGINTWFISKYAKANGLKAVLSGVGGDELYGGYPSFNRMKVVEKLEKLPDIFLKNSYKTSLKKIHRLCYLSLEGAKGKYLFLRGHFIPDEIARHLNMDEKEVWDILKEEPVLDNISNLSLKNQASSMEMNLYMQNQLLRDADIMSMAHGVEIRVPFLDKEFITLSLQIQTSIKYAGNYRKQLLIDAFKDILPEPIWNRPKMGFSFPFKDWLANDEYVKNIIHSGSDAVKKDYIKFRSGKLHWFQLLSLILLQHHAKG